MASLFLAKILSTLLVGAGSLAAQSQIFNLTGERRDDRAGLATAAADINADGYVDVIIGTPSVAALSSPVRVLSGRDGKQLLAIEGKTRTGGFGLAVAAIGDVNSDGRVDFAVAAPSGRNGAGSATGYVRMISGRNGSTLWTTHGQDSGDIFGFEVRRAGDCNRDGVQDVIVATSLGANYARLLNGRTGAVLRHFAGPSRSSFGKSVDGAGDVDGDGVADVVIGAPRLVGLQAYLVGAAFIYSGATGKEIRGYYASNYRSWLGSRVRSAGDLDRDGVPDLLVSGINHASARGLVKVISNGKSAQNVRVLHVLQGMTAGEYFGRQIESIGDLNGDRRSEFAVGTQSDAKNGPMSGATQVFDGNSGKVLFSVFGQSYDALGTSLAAGDINRDGTPDVLIGIPGFKAPVGSNAGAVRVLSGRELMLSTDNHELSLSTGGTQTFEVRAGLQHAQRFFFILGSASGVAPGLQVAPGVRLPLNWDGYSDFTLSSRNAGFYQGTFGRLDASGEATARLVLPPLMPPALVGTRLDHAFAVFAGNTVYAASNPVPVMLVR